MKNIRLLILLAWFGMVVTGCVAKTALPHSVSGTWRIQLTTKDIGVADAVFTFEVQDTQFTAATHPNADRMILGFGKSVLARTFSSAFQHGSLIHIAKGHISGSGHSYTLKGIYVSAAGNYYFNAKISNDILSGELTDGKGKAHGILRGTKYAGKLPLKNYPQIMDSVIANAETRIYNKAILQTERWKYFVKSIRKTAPQMQDDIDAVFCFFYEARKLPFSHFYFLKMQPDSAGDETAAVNVHLKEISPATVCLDISSFGGNGREMDSVFDVIRVKGYKNLVVDLRNNSGGGIEAGMHFAANLSDSPRWGGIFLTRKWFNTHDAAPSVSQYNQFPVFDRSSYDELVYGIRNSTGWCLKLVPGAHPFKGHIYLLTSKTTASTCEPIVYAFKQYHIATIVGGVTAGAMLNSEKFKLPDGFTLYVPTADYYCADGYRIDGKGVQPDIKTEPKDALDYVLKNLVK